MRTAHEIGTGTIGRAAVPSSGIHPRCAAVSSLPSTQHDRNSTWLSSRTHTSRFPACTAPRRIRARRARPSRSRGHSTRTTSRSRVEQTEEERRLADALLASSGPCRSARVSGASSPAAATPATRPPGAAVRSRCVRAAPAPPEPPRAHRSRPPPRLRRDPARPDRPAPRAHLFDMPTHPTSSSAGMSTPTIRIGQAAELLGVGVETLRRWELEGRLATTRTDGGQRRVAIAEVTRLLAERRRSTQDRPIVAQSARNRFAGIVTRIERDRRGGRRRGDRRPAPAGQPDDRGGGRGARAEGRATRSCAS